MTMPISESSQPWIIYDNHLVKMKDGVLIHTFEGVTWDNSVSPKPEWWDLTKTYTLKTKLIPGGRGNIYVFRSNDCGGSWQPASNIDAATLTVAGTPGYCGHPRLRLDEGVKKAEAGGWDGHLVNVGHNGTDLYLTTPCAYGTPLAAGQTTNEWHTDGLILRSVDSGKSWTVVCHVPDVAGSFWRVPVTTVPSGMVAFAVVRDGKLWLARFPATGSCDASGATDHLATDVTPDKRTSSQKDEATVNTFMWGFASIARGSITSDNVQVSTYNWFENGTRLGYKIVERRADPEAPSTASPLVIPITGQGEGSDILHGEFVEGPPQTRTNLFYYLERMPGTPNSFRVGFKLHEKGASAGQGFLTVKGGKPYTWTYKDTFVGDYMTGDSYTSGNKIVFVMPWSQNGALYFNTVTWKSGS
jgi:hypothetical protein